MARGRKPLAEKRLEITLNLPADLMAEVDFYLLDPASGKPAYGARSQLVTLLLRFWVERSKKRLGGQQLGYSKESSHELSEIVAELGLPVAAEDDTAVAAQPAGRNAGTTGEGGE